MTIRPLLMHNANALLLVIDLLLGKLHVDVRDIAYCLLFGATYVFWHQFVRYHRTRTLLYFFLNWQSPHALKILLALLSAMRSACAGVVLLGASELSHTYDGRRYLFSRREFPGGDLWDSIVRVAIDGSFGPASVTLDHSVNMSHNTAFLCVRNSTLLAIGGQLPDGEPSVARWQPGIVRRSAPASALPLRWGRGEH